jgi:hypothetical protein
MSRDVVSPLVISLLLVSGASGAPVPKPSPEQVRKELDAAWADLLSADEQTAGRALLRFASRPDEAVEYLKEKLRPLKLTKERVAQLLADLGSEDETVARAAFEEFSYFDPRLALGDEELRDALLDKPASRRLGAILCDLPIDGLAGEKWHWHSPDNKVYRFNCGEAVSNRDAAITVGLVGTVGRKASWVRATRAIVVLEFVGTPKARATLDEMATGHPGAAPTKAAQLARERLRR